MLKGLCSIQRTVIQLTHDGTTTYIVRTKAGSPAGMVDVVLTVPSGMQCGAVSTDWSAIDWGTGWAAGSTFKVINLGTICGIGGYGGNGRGCDSAGYGFPGGIGGAAMNLRGLTVTIDNGGGYIFGGGGGGAGAPGSPNYAPYHDTNKEGGGSGGGGGQGLIASAAGTGYNTLLGLDGFNGSAGDFYGPGDGGISGGDEIGGGISRTVRAGARGGGWGEYGEQVNYGGIITAGGAPGKAIELAGGAVIWIAGNNPSQVRGTIA